MKIELKNGIKIVGVEFINDVVFNNGNTVIKGLMIYNDKIYIIRVLPYELEDISIMDKDDAIKYLSEIDAIELIG